MIDGVPNDKIDSKFNAERRKFGQMVLGGTLGAAALFTPTAMSPATVHQNAPGIKLCGQFPAKPTDDDLLFLKQIGVQYVSVASTPDLRTAEGFSRSRRVMRTPASRFGTSETPMFITCRKLL
jgi:hypothetical protein